MLRWDWTIFWGWLTILFDSKKQRIKPGHRLVLPVFFCQTASNRVCTLQFQYKEVLWKISQSINRKSEDIVILIAITKLEVIAHYSLLHSWSDIFRLSRRKRQSVTKPIAHPPSFFDSFKKRHSFPSLLAKVAFLKITIREYQTHFLDLN